MWIITLTSFYFTPRKNVCIFSITVQWLTFQCLALKWSRIRCFTCVVYINMLTFFLLHGTTQPSQESFERVVKQHMNRCLWMINVLFVLTSEEKCASTPPPPSPNPPLLSSSELLCSFLFPLCACSPPVCSCCPSLGCAAVLGSLQLDYSSTVCITMY